MKNSLKIILMIAALAVVGFAQKPHSLVEEATVTLTNAQLLTLPTTAVEIVPAPGPNRVLQLIAAFGTVDANAGGYTNICPAAGNGIALGLGGRRISGLSDTYFQFADTSGPWSFQLYSRYQWVSSSGILYTDNDQRLSAVANQPMYATFLNGSCGNLTGGNASNEVKLYVMYRVVNL